MSDDDGLHLPQTLRVVGYYDNGRTKDLMVEHLDRAGLLDIFEKQWPDLWAKCYPRIYDGAAIGHYHSPKTPAFDMASAVMKRHMPGTGRAEVYDYILANRLAMFGMPTYFLSSDIALAIRHTTPPMDFEWHDMELPFDAAIFMLPKGTLAHEVDGDCAYVAYARCKKGEIYPCRLVPAQKTCGITNGGFLVMTSTLEPPRTYHYHWPFEHEVDPSPIIHLNDLESYMVKGVDDTSPIFFPNGMEPADDRLLRKVAHFVFGALMLMLNRPELITRGTLRKRIQKAGQLPREFWTPHIIGEHFHLRREPGPSLGGTHASPRGHWVKGTWRNQAHGPKRSLRKEIWIEPYWRGGAG